MFEKYSCVITSHLNPNLSGVAKFNYIIAQKFNTPYVTIHNLPPLDGRPVLISLKLTDAKPGDFGSIDNIFTYLVQKNNPFDLFMHQLSDYDLEKRLFQKARKIFCGNREMYENLGEFKDKGVLAWCPSLVDFKETIDVNQSLQLFSFGMAHKIKTEFHQKLKQALDNINVDYSLWISCAFHEKAQFSDFDHISQKLTGLYGDKMRFLGFMSDDGVNHFLNKSDAAIAFFNEGVRSNNTSLYASMERGCAVIVNVDHYSPEWLEHGRNIIDINRLEEIEMTKNNLAQIGKNAREDVLANSRWDKLLELFEAN
jgi:hypothetical protein